MLQHSANYQDPGIPGQGTAFTTNHGSRAEAAECEPDGHVARAGIERETFWSAQKEELGDPPRDRLECEEEFS